LCARPAQRGFLSPLACLGAVGAPRGPFPGLRPPPLAAPIVGTAGPWAMAAARHAPALRYPTLLVVAFAAALVAVRGERLWSRDLASLSPVPRADQLLDEQMRADLGAPDVRFLVVVHARDTEAALQASEAIGRGLDKAVAAG